MFFAYHSVTKGPLGSTKEDDSLPCALMVLLMVALILGVTLS